MNLGNSEKVYFWYTLGMKTVQFVMTCYDVCFIIFLLDCIRIHYAHWIKQEWFEPRMIRRHMENLEPYVREERIYADSFLSFARTEHRSILFASSVCVQTKHALACWVQSPIPGNICMTDELRDISLYCFGVLTLHQVLLKW